MVLRKITDDEAAKAQDWLKYRPVELKLLIKLLSVQILELEEKRHRAQCALDIHEQYNENGETNDSE